MGEQMSPHQSRLSWHRTTTGRLRLRISDPALAGLHQGFEVPAEIEADLDKLFHDRPIETDEVDQASDPATDLILLESHFRREAVRLENITHTLAATVQTTPAAASRLSGLARVCGRRRRSIPADVDTTTVLAATVARNAVRDRMRALREFVIVLDMPDGLLAQARAGWQRNSTQPAYVSSYASETLFAIADPRRANSRPDGGRGIAGELFGVGWRRDGDDDDPHAEEPTVFGPWQLGYIRTTGEVYATRRCHYLDEEVWLLGRLLADPDTARQLLTNLKQHMREPNSLLRVAQTIHTVIRGTTHDIPVSRRRQG
jgi:hypothetical protein